MEEGYPRNRVIIEGLRSNGVEVTECHEDFWKGTAEKLEGVKAGSVMVKTIFRLMRIYGRLILKFRHAGDYDAMIVGYAGHVDIFLAKILNLFRRKPVIFDAFLSVYDTAVMDRKIVLQNSLKAKLLRLVDKWSCNIADSVLLDTKAHIDYFVREFHLPASKFYAIPVGSSLTTADSAADSGDTILNSLPTSPSQRIKYGVPGTSGALNILYFGSYIPLHGVDVILRAAEILQGEKDIVFTLIGKGQLLPEMKQLASKLGLRNVNFIDRFVEEGELSGYIQRSDICLGIFGKTDKAMRVIPCKVYNCLAMGKPLITAMTPATEGVLTNMDNAMLCNAGDPESLSEAILSLKKDEALREKIAIRGQKYFAENFSADAIGKRIVEIVEKVKNYSGSRGMANGR